ncbi:hypothetical protein F5Y16DRAFT_422923 [Xylariaceae sp. FL0255]|nr:hypothetical protein F5Y16DRAFT_422923 [Xylariaceae sp. FL0255]
MLRVSLLSLLAVSASAACTPRGNPSVNEQLEQAFEAALANFHKNSSSSYSTTCTLENLQIRREWGSLSTTERTNYIKAPANTPSSVAPGAKTRFDDFVATHINQTLAIHYTGNFLTWHRYFTWLYEQVLRDECGYDGTQPYWDWAKTAEYGLENSPIFDGSDTSISGNGEYIPDQGQVVLGGNGLPPVYLDPGDGGGCVTSGPFKDLVVNLGPAALSEPGGTTAANPNGPLSYNPRCLKRSLTQSINDDYANVTAILSLFLNTHNVYDFQMQMQGIPGSGNIGVHGGGHYTLGGDPGRDVYVSPGDPAFYLHHSMIDRTYWIWQNLGGPEARFSGTTGLSGTNTFLNSPPSANTTYEDFVEYGYAAGPPRQIKDLMRTTSGPFCYIYA